MMLYFGNLSRLKAGLRKEFGKNKLSLSTATLLLEKNY